MRRFPLTTSPVTAPVTLAGRGVATLVSERLPNADVDTSVGA